MIDSYQTPAAESLLRLARERHAGGDRARRLTATELAGAAAFLAVAVPLALLAPSPRTVTAWPLLATALVYLVAARVEFPVGSAWSAPTQLAFVPMLFVLPTAAVPLIVAACSVAGRLPRPAGGRFDPGRLLARVGDSFYSLGPALVLVLGHGQTFAWRHWPLYLGAFAAQIAFDAGAGLARTWFAEGVRPSGQLPMVWLYGTDASLSCVGLAIAAAAASTNAGLVTLALPLVGLMGLLGRERRQRLEYSLALSRAYDEVRDVNDELHETARVLAAQKRDIEVKNEEIELSRRGLQEKAAELALASRYKSEFLANVSHELRTPLNSMLLLARLLAENHRGALSEREVEFARTIGSAGHDLLTLINDILDLSKVEAGRMELDLAPVDLSGLGAEIERHFCPLAEEQGLSFALELDPVLPATIVSDRQRLGQVLKNLLSNAFKFTHEGSVTLSIAAAAEEELIVFAISDTGIGIPEDKRNAIFEAFQQGDGSTARKYGGTGLGLSISRELARLLGGEIQVESALGQGSRFSLLVPPIPRASTPAVPALPVRPTARDPSDETVPDDRGQIDPDDRVLLVMDTEAGRARTIVEVAHRRGEKAIVAGESTTALELVREHRPYAMVLAGDASRIESGLAELKRHGETRHVPVVAIGGAAVRLPALRRGAAAFVERSLDVAALELALTHVDHLAEKPFRRVALVERRDAADHLEPVLRSIDEVEVTRLEPADAAVALRATPYDLAVLAFDDSGGDAYDTLRALVTEDVLRDLPLVAYVSPELSTVGRARLDALAKAAVIAVVDSPEHLADRATLFLHRAQATLPTSMQSLLTRLTDGNAPLQGRKVLVIDDDVRSAFALTSVLEEHDMKVVYAGDGREGLERLQQHANTDVVLLDIMMPDMDGYETMRAIRAMSRFAQMPIIALTAKAMNGDRAQVIATGASDYIDKPVDVDRLLSMMRTWLLMR